MKCPICKADVAPADPQTPFCSERCRVIDLGNWAAEKYRIPGTASDAEEEEQEGNNERDQ
jgi:endogenous inhibitor of DNA gyrase (YacG/DUF329 family)